MQYLLEAIQAVPHINSLSIQRTLLTHIEKKKETGLRTLLLQFLLFYYLTCDRDWIPTKAWAQVVGMGRRRTEDDARPTASGRCGRARRRRQVAARVWGSPGSLRETERYDCSCLIQTKDVTVFIKKRGK